MSKKSAAEIAFEALPQEQRAIVAPVMTAIEQFKAEHAEALKTKANFADVVTQEKLDKATADIEALKAAVNEAVAKMNRGGGGNDGDVVAEKLEQLHAIEMKAMGEFIRRGDIGALHRARADGARIESELKAAGVEMKDLSTVMLEDGGALVHPQVEADMIEVIEEISPMRAICGQIQAETGEVEIPVDMGGWEAVWIDELTARAKTTTGEFAQRRFSAEEVYAYPKVTQRMLEDARGFDVEGWLYTKATKAIARAEGKAFITGDGNKKPKGILKQTIVDNSSWAWGKLGYIATGKAGAFKDSAPGSAVGPTGAVNPADCLIDLAYAVPKPLRNNCNWVLNRKTLAAVRKLKDGDGQYVWRDQLTQSGLLTTILGHPVTEAEDMPDIAADSYSIAFGDFEEGYLIVDRTGIMVKRDDITQPGFVLIFFRRRVGGDVQDYQAIKLLKFAAS